MSPSDLRTADEKLYIRLNGCPKNIILMYNMDFSITSGGVSILSRRKGERKKPIIKKMNMNLIIRIMLEAGLL